MGTERGPQPGQIALEGEHIGRRASLKGDCGASPCSEGLTARQSAPLLDADQMSEAHPSQAAPRFLLPRADLAASLCNSYHPLPVVFERAEGALVWDPEVRPINPTAQLSRERTQLTLLHA